MSNLERLPLPEKAQKQILKTKRPGIYQVIDPSGKESWKACAFNKGRTITETFSKESLAITWKKKNEVHAEESVRSKLAAAVVSRNDLQALANRARLPLRDDMPEKQKDRKLAVAFFLQHVTALGLPVGIVSLNIENGLNT